MRASFPQEWFASAPPDSAGHSPSMLELALELEVLAAEASALWSRLRYRHRLAILLRLRLDDRPAASGSAAPLQSSAAALPLCPHLMA